ncbi:hypothetical protein [Colwellia sp. 20A7]|uniref:hypothetical protein n=1 Tax=Colwellia sp. 20A7 TaxID=2689569 RepID=UPI0013580754
MTEIAPSIKCVSANTRTKPTTLSTASIVHMPEHIFTGDKIKVNASDYKFTERSDSK